MNINDSDTWKEYFFKDSFTVDGCLTENTRKYDLVSLRRDLKCFGTELQLQMSEILKSETESIVNLAEYLTNLNLKIDNLAVPLSQLQEETHSLCDLVQAAESSYGTTLEGVKNNNLKQNHLNLKLKIISTSKYLTSVIDSIETGPLKNLLLLERLVSKYTFEKIFLEELSLTTPGTEKVLSVVESKIVYKVNDCFLYALDGGDTLTLIRCLRMYVDMKKQDEAHNVYRIYKLKPLLEGILCETYLEKCDQDLSKVYLKVRDVLDTSVATLCHLVCTKSDLKGFNFVLSSFWKEFDRQSRENLPHITAPGNPDLFQKRFRDTYNLLTYIAIQAGDPKLIRRSKCFKDHLKRFNLPVYFEIKFQQISGDFENKVIDLKYENIFALENSQGFKLNPTVALWKALQRCFDKDIYIEQLSDQFIRLAMMLLSRYLKAMDNLLRSMCSSPDLAKDKMYDFLLNSITDFHVIQSLVAPKCGTVNDVAKTMYAVIETNMWVEVLKVIELNEKILSEVRTSFSDYFASSTISECTSQLENVTSIPRLYRRTNRNPPKEASAYVVEAIKPIEAFVEKFGTDLRHLRELLEHIIIEITNRYSTLVEEVLRSVCKTEESLRRLKNRALNTSGSSLPSDSRDTVSDEAKIKEQIKCDVCYFCEKLQPLVFETAKEKLDLLKYDVSK